MAVTTSTVAESCAAAKRAARTLASAPTAAKDAALEATARLLEERAEEILEANEADLADERAAGLTEALRDRLTLTPERVAAMAEGVRVVAALDDPVGEELERKTLESGLDLRKVRVPLGVVAVVYEARPNVTIDCAALTIKSGNAIVLRGSQLRGALERGAGGGGPRGARRGGPARGLGAAARRPAAATTWPSWRPRRALVDLLIPRGGEGLKEAIKAVATVPVMYAAAGNCHVYVHAEADLEMARRIAFNAKIAAPGGLQRGRDAADRRRGRGRASRRRCSPSWPRPGSSWSATSGRGRLPARSRWRRRATRTGTPSTWR